MSADNGAPRALPSRPSSQHLSKQAKRLAKARAIQLAAAQQILAARYGFANWAALMAHVRALEPGSTLSALAEAARAGRTAEPAAVESARRRVDWRRVTASEEAIRLGEGIEVTLNGIAQGFAADCVAAVLGSHGVRHALIDTGELLGLGRKEGAAPWRVGIQHPRHHASPAA